MAQIRPFKGIRPNKEKAAAIAALPYDVYNRKEACEVVKNNAQSFLKIDRAETQFSDDVDTYDERVYQKAKEMLEEMIKDGSFIQDAENCYYLYELTMNGRSQTGIVACASIDDYHNNVIKKHENTRKEKELDRIHHVDTLSAQTGPIFLAYRQNQRLNEIVTEAMEKEALYDFTAEDGVRHRVFAIRETETVNEIASIFDQISDIYIADGHHRAASAVHVGDARRAAHPNYTGEEEFNYFLSVLFPNDQLMIMDYNRVVKDLNGNTPKDFLEKVSQVFQVAEGRKEQIEPSIKGEISMYLDGKWYGLKVREETRPKDPVEGLDVAVLQNQLLAPVLGIQDPKTDDRIDFVGGIRGLAELEKRAQTDCKVAFAMYATSIDELFDVADAGLLMPPKSTWFEPKLRSGLFIHKIER